MIFRLLMSFVILAGSISAFLHLALCTDWLKNPDRIRRYARNATVLAAGGIIATFSLALLVLLTT